MQHTNFNDKIHYIIRLINNTYNQFIDFKKEVTLMLNIEKIYKETKYLDNLFSLQFDIKSPEIIKKYKLELLVEFGELANETRCFKFWSINQTGKKNRILEEYIDCLFMILYFCNITNVSLRENFSATSNKDIIETFLTLYKLGNDLVQKLEKETVKKLLVEILYLSQLLEFTLEDLTNETKRKSQIIQKRLKSNY